VFLPHILRFHEGAADAKYVRSGRSMGLKPGADLADAIQDLNNSIGIPKNLKGDGARSVGCAPASSTMP
jgi:4-hydroxybutyrate dehydrogenase